MALTKKQEELLKAITQELRRETALAYIRNGYTNQTKSYLDACESMGRKPSKNPETSASEILGYPNVIEFINSVRLAAAESANTDAKWLLKRLREVDDLDILDIMQDDLTGFKPLNEWPKVWRTNISGVDISTMMLGDDIETTIKKIKWPDKVKNREMIGRHVTVKAWDKEVEQEKTIAYVMAVPTADSVEAWEDVAKQQQSDSLSNG